MGSPTKRIQYRYDARGNRHSMIDPEGGRFTYSYDARNRIQHLVNPQGERTTYSYDSRNRRTETRLANGTRTSYSYDSVSNLERLSNLKSDGTVISDFQYSYDRTGNRTSVLEGDGRRVTWSYDAASQLICEHRPAESWNDLSLDDWDTLSPEGWGALSVDSSLRSTYTYDPAGNRTLKNEGGARTTYSYDAANQLKWSQDTSGRTTYTFDADGNQQRVLAPDGSQTTTVWDYENRTTSVQLPSGIRNTMAYESEGLRVKLDESAGTKKFVWDDQNYLVETDALNDTQVVYTNEPRYYGNLISQRRGSTTSWYHFDALGSTRQLTDATQAITDQRLYDAWGTVIGSTGSTVFPFKYVGDLGYYEDGDALGVYVRARRYVPKLAAWVSVDPLYHFSTVQLDPHLVYPLFKSRNPYAYTSSSPLSASDPSGLQEPVLRPSVPAYPSVPGYEGYPRLSPGTGRLHPGNTGLLPNVGTGLGRLILPVGVGATAILYPRSIGWEDERCGRPVYRTPTLPPAALPCGDDVPNNFPWDRRRFDPLPVYGTCNGEVMYIQRVESADDWDPDRPPNPETAPKKDPEKSKTVCCIFKKGHLNDRGALPTSPRGVPVDFSIVQFQMGGPKDAPCSFLCRMAAFNVQVLSKQGFTGHGCYDGTCNLSNWDIFE